MADPSAVDYVQAGGLLAFAGAVYYEVRQLRPFIIRVAELLAVLVYKENAAGNLPSAVPREQSRPVRAPTSPSVAGDP